MSHRHLALSLILGMGASADFVHTVRVGSEPVLLWHSPIGQEAEDMAMAVTVEPGDPELTLVISTRADGGEPFIGSVKDGNPFTTSVNDCTAMEVALADPGPAPATATLQWERIGPTRVYESTWATSPDRGAVLVRTQKTTSMAFLVTNEGSETATLTFRGGERVLSTLTVPAGKALTTVCRGTSIEVAPGAGRGTFRFEGR